MTAGKARRAIPSRPVSATAGEPFVRPADYTTHGHHFQCRRSRWFLV